MTPPRTVACYIRTPSYHSDALTQQIRITRQFLRTQLGAYASVIYCDEAHSGTTLDRPGLQSLLAHVEAGGVEAVVVAEYHRLSRIHTQLLTVQMKLERANVALWVAAPHPRLAPGLPRSAPHSFLYDAPIPEARP
ncbi:MULTISPECIES: recombinase family protein [Lysobacter]|uniref:Recombinase family protein n=1 Tax=Lysobacter yananisis TaxID=1003114 RepID=A0ABY9PDM4_9GAMM|nr:MULTISPECIES: recombinase family protein [Lysobacter]QQQ00934.1 recombinase family protein [Lysobacter enzymogenes]WMT04150.1 recombinase family protein [Lysobacter yananisis]